MRDAIVACIVLVCCADVSVLAAQSATRSTTRLPSARQDFWQEVNRIARIPRVTIIESIRFVQAKVNESFPFDLATRQDEDKPDANQLYQQTIDEIRKLELLSLDQTLTREDVRPTWGIMMKFHQAGDERTYERLINLYEKLHELKLPAVDRLETIRLLGQHQYLLGNNGASAAIFAKASDIVMNDLSEEDRESCMDALGNILYLNGLALTKRDESGKAAIENFERIVNDPELIEYVDKASVVNMYQRLGRLRWAEEEFGKAEEAFKSGKEFLDKLDASHLKTEKQYRIGIEVERSHAAAMADDAESPDLRNVLEELNALEEKYKEQGYPGFDFLLRRRILIAKEVGSEEFGDALEDMRSWYVDKHSITRGWERADKDGFIKVSELLINFFLEQKNKERVKELLVETKRLGELHKHWFLRFPRSIVQEAFEKSVLDGDE